MDETVFVSLRKFPKALKARMANWKPHYEKHLGLKHISNEQYFAKLIAIGLDQVMPGGVGVEEAVFEVPEGIKEWTGELQEHEEVMG